MMGTFSSSRPLAEYMEHFSDAAAVHALVNIEHKYYYLITCHQLIPLCCDDQTRLSKKKRLDTRFME